MDRVKLAAAAVSCFVADGYNRAHVIINDDIIYTQLKSRDQQHNELAK